MSLENSVVLGRYRVLWLVDQKKLAKTYIARDEAADAFGTPVLIKQFLHELGERDSPLMRTLSEELVALTGLRHTGVVPLLDYGVVDDRLVTASAHVPGAELSRVCEELVQRQQPFPPHLAIYVVRRLLQTLHHCHTRDSRRFVHGRVTLGCIYVPTSGEPQLTDFGLASLEDVAAEEESQLGFFQTRVSFASPEVTRGAAPSPQGDTYSLALLLYRLLAGTNPFRGRSVPETMQRVLQLTPAALVMPDWAPCAHVNQILTRALSKDMQLRHQSCLELSDDLASVQVGTYDSLAEELGALVRRHSNADWRQMARLTRPVRSSSPPGDSRRRQALASAPAVAESHPPGPGSLLSDKPVSVSDLTGRDGTQLRRGRRRQLAMLPTVLLPAAAIMLGLFLGRLGGVGLASSGPRPASGHVQLVNRSVADLQEELRECLDPGASEQGESKLELEFAADGQLSEVRLRPEALARSRLGACLLKRVWDAGVSAPAAMSLVIPIAEGR